MLCTRSREITSTTKRVIMSGKLRRRECYCYGMQKERTEMSYRYVDQLEFHPEGYKANSKMVWKDNTSNLCMCFSVYQGEKKERN